MVTRAAAVRVSASAFSWVLFAFCFTLLLLTAAAIVGLGGTSCASGGPFDVRTQCPDAIGWLIMVPLPLAFVALGVGAYLGRGFGTPLTSWAFPLTFLGFGITFFIGAFAAGVGWGFIVCGALFLVMGTTWLVIVLRADPRRALIGQVDIHGRRFVAGPRARRGFFRELAAEGAKNDPSSMGHSAAIQPTARDGMLSLGIPIVSAGLGVVLAMLLFAALGG
jgi:hypothetical protein